MPLELDAVRAFLSVAQDSSFTKAAVQLGLSKSRVSLLVQSLETELGCRLFQRSTRAVLLTSDGEQFMPRAQRLSQDAEELSTMFRAPRTLKGRLRIDLPVNIARDWVLPRLPDFTSLYPQLEIQLSTTDRIVDVLREGFDCVLRVGALADSSLVSKRIGLLSMVNCASAAYLAKHGVPHTLDDLDHHFLVHYSWQLNAEPPTFEYREGQRFKDKTMRSQLTVNNVDAYHAACLAGFGIAQIGCISLGKGASGERLVEILPQLMCKPLPVSLLHGYSRSVPQRVRVFMSWLERVLAPYLE